MVKVVMKEMKNWCVCDDMKVTGSYDHRCAYRKKHCNRLYSMPLLQCRGVHGNGNSHGNGIPLGIPWEWE